MGWGSVQVEYTLAVTDNGHEHLIEPDQKLVHVAVELIPSPFRWHSDGRGKGEGDGSQR